MFRVLVCLALLALGSTARAATATNQQPAQSGGLAMFREIVPANTTSVAIKGGPGQLYSIDAFSIAATAPVFIKFYDAVQSGTTCGSGTPKFGPFMIPAAGGAPGSGFTLHDTNGYEFQTAITMCVTNLMADADATNPAAASYAISIGYR